MLLIFFRHVVLDVFFIFFFFNDTATTEIYTLSLHDALPIWATRGLDRRFRPSRGHVPRGCRERDRVERQGRRLLRDRKSTRLNSSHGYISYAVFCLKKKKKKKQHDPKCASHEQTLRNHDTIH